MCMLCVRGGFEDSALNTFVLLLQDLTAESVTNGDHLLLPSQPEEWKSDAQIQS